MKGFNFAAAYDRPQDAIAPYEQAPAAQGAIDYTDYGILPGVAQSAQNTPYVTNPTPAPYFSDADLALANWFTTRVHLAPLGKANQ